MASFERSWLLSAAAVVDGAGVGASSGAAFL